MIKNVHHPAYIALIDLLVTERNRQGLTVRQLAEIIGEDGSFVTKVETRVRKLSAIEYFQYCKALEINPVKGIEVFWSHSDK